ncbi:hypothetical protein [Agrobacterium larrymoorei]|uniref:Growth inhibitor PemK n=1 Tax=Agrobacterium larrymoorei TaxID=160699 RepID=A0AAF0KEH2_9HYPH|nr:hypothetical protein [Agrobacterium larrymoorei]WHA42118.1 hypothetical protein CFBP5477_005680 [Agrobacterium larrymoorei]
MNYPEPVPGLVIRFDYLWHADSQKGLSSSEKERPCAIVLYAKKSNKTLVVPISHSYPEMGEEDYSLEIPADICALIGLDEERNWVRVSEVNEFEWPSSDIRPRPDDPSRSDYGMIPEAFFLQIRRRLADAVAKNRLARAKR